MQPWKSWSIPITLAYMRRRLCGLLNKLSNSNFDSISDQVVRLAISVERTDDADILDAFVRDIFSRGIHDPLRVEVYAALCQKIMDELEGERSLWRRVDLFHLGNPMNCFETNLRLLSQYEFDRLIDSGFQDRESWDRLFALAAFVGEMLVEGMLLSNDVTGIVEGLFDKTLNSPSPDDSGEFAVAICRFLHPIVRAFNAFAQLEPLHIAVRLEHVLQEGSNISLRSRCMMMNMLDQVLYPRPQDAFSSTRQRVEVYGLDPDDSDFESYPASEVNIITPSGASLTQICRTQARLLMHSRQITPMEQLCRQLRPEDRSILIASLVSEVLFSGDASDASLVGSIFLDDSIRDHWNHDKGCFVNGFEIEISHLEDSLLDVPDGYHLMAIMLHGSPLSHYDVEELVAGSESLGEGGCKRLLDAYNSLGGSHSRVESIQEDNGEEQYGSDSFVVM